MSSPKVDWYWAFTGDPKREDIRQLPPTGYPAERYRRMLRWAWALPHVWLPHALAVVLGLVLFVAAWAGSVAPSGLEWSAWSWLP